MTRGQLYHLHRTSTTCAREAEVHRDYNVVPVHLQISEQYFDFCPQIFSVNCITTFFNHLGQKNVGGWREITRRFNHRNKASPRGCDYRQRDMQKRRADSYNGGFCIIQFYKLRLHTPNPVKPFQQTQRDGVHGATSSAGREAEILLQEY